MTNRTATKKKRAAIEASGVPFAIYARISRNRSLTEQIGIDNQVAACRAYAAERGLVVGPVFSDNDKSAFEEKWRPGYEAMLDEVRAGRVSGILAWDPDRLHRNPTTLERFIDTVDETGAAVETVEEGTYDLTTVGGRMVARMLGAVARAESEHKRARLHLMHDARAAKGLNSGGGARPYGYRTVDELNDEGERIGTREVVVEEEAAIIREMVERTLAGESMRGLLLDLNARGVATVKGKTWSAVVVKRLLMSERLIGRRSHLGESIADAPWPAIISVADHVRLVTLFSDPSRKCTKPARAYLLAGLVHCSLCDAVLVSRPNGGKRHFVCSKGPGLKGCGGMTVVAGDHDNERAGVEVGIIEAILDDVHLTGSAPVAAANDADVDELIPKLQRKRAELAERLANDDDYEYASFIVSDTRLRERIAEARALVAVDMSARALAPYGEPGSLRAAWPTRTFDERRAIIAAIVARVTVFPGTRGANRFDPTRVSVDWLR